MFLLSQALSVWTMVYMTMFYTFWGEGGVGTKRLEYRTLGILSKPVLLGEMPVPVWSTHSE